MAAQFFSEPHPDIKQILGTQKIIKTLLDHVDDWPSDITNGTILVMDKFLDYTLDPIPENINPVNSSHLQMVSPRGLFHGKIFRQAFC